MSDPDLPQVRALLEGLLSERLPESALDWLAAARTEMLAGAADDRFCALLSGASRHARRRSLDPSDSDLQRAEQLAPGWNLARYTQLETLRLALIIGRTDVSTERFERAYEEAFRHADEGEERALFRALAVLPAGERFVWRAGEGCRTNIIPVFESVACDSPFAARHFDDIAWRQLCLKAVFIGAPLWRVYGLDQRLDPELARMALDLVDERRSAGRAIQPDLWLCLGPHAGERGLAALQAALAGDDAQGRLAATLALARAEAHEHLEALTEDSDSSVAAAASNALTHIPDASAWAVFQS